MNNTMRSLILVPFLILAMAGCALQNPVQRVAVYDFGPGPLTSVAPAPADRLPVLQLEVLDGPAALDSTVMLYRLAYADDQQLRPYTLARWSMTPAQLLRQHLRQQLGQRRTLLSPFDSSSQDASKALVLQIEIEEFSQLFESADKSSGLLRLRATLSRAGPPGGGWLAQRTLTLQQSAATADAPGGVRALAASAKAAAQELDRWLGEFGD